MRLPGQHVTLRAPASHPPHLLIHRRIRWGRRRAATPSVLGFMIGSRSAGAFRARALTRQLSTFTTSCRHCHLHTQQPQRARPQQSRLSGAGRASPSAARAAAASGSAIMAAADGRQASVRGELVDLFRTAIDTAFPDAGEVPIVAPTNNPKFGDYQCNNAMPLHGRLKGKEGAPKAPRDVATKIVAALPANDLIADTSLAGPGFINVKIRPDFLAARVLGMLRRWMAFAGLQFGCMLISCAAMGACRAVIMVSAGGRHHDACVRHRGSCAACLETQPATPSSQMACSGDVAPAAAAWPAGRPSWTRSA
jgi:Arginyl tRNA synthetase N terminal domain